VVAALVGEFVCCTPSPLSFKVRVEEELELPPPVDEQEGFVLLLLDEEPSRSGNTWKK
jgi:hypothetical protein